VQTPLRSYTSTQIAAIAIALDATLDVDAARWVLWAAYVFVAYEDRPLFSLDVHDHCAASSGMPRALRHLADMRAYGSLCVYETAQFVQYAGPEDLRASLAGGFEGVYKTEGGVTVYVET